jgi:hypothetical protein
MSRPTDQLDNSHTKPLQMEHHEQISSDRSQTDGRPENSESQARQFLPNSLIASQRKPGRAWCEDSFRPKMIRRSNAYGAGSAKSITSSF